MYVIWEYKWACVGRGAFLGAGRSFPAGLDCGLTHCNTLEKGSARDTSIRCGTYNCACHAHTHTHTCTHTFSPHARTHARTHACTCTHTFSSTALPCVTETERARERERVCTQLCRDSRSRLIWFPPLYINPCVNKEWLCLINNPPPPPLVVCLLATTSCQIRNTDDTHTHTHTHTHIDVHVDVNVDVDTHYTTCKFWCTNAPRHVSASVSIPCIST